MSVFSPYRFLHSIHTSLNVTFTPAPRRDLPPASPGEHHQPASRQEPPRPNRPLWELRIRARLAPSGISHQSWAQSWSWRCCCELFSGRNRLHGLILMAGSAFSFGPVPCAGLWSERKASSVKADLPRHTFRDGFSSSLLVKINSTEDNGAKPTQVKAESDRGSKKHLFHYFPNFYCCKYINLCVNQLQRS